MLAAIEDAVEAIGRGEIVVVVDDPGRENEGDLVMAAEFATPEAINFMAVHGRGLICAPMPAERLDELGIAPMVARNTDPKGTAFRVSVDLAGATTTGISASDRAKTIAALADPVSRAPDFSRPGHVFPLAARAGGVLERPGHTEASIDLAVLAGLAPAAVICEIAGADGEMARLPELLAFAGRHGLLVVAISDLIAYRRLRERHVTRVSEARMPLEHAEFTAVGYRDAMDGREHLALVLGDVRDRSDVLVRMHSECFMGDVLGATGCDCGRQLELSLLMIVEEGAGAVVYVRAGEHHLLAHSTDVRDLEVGAQILEDLGIREMRSVPAAADPVVTNVHSLSAERARRGHLFDEGPSIAAFTGWR